MKISFIIVLSFLGFLSAFGQAFEGEIVYENNLVSRIHGISDEKLTAMFGNRQEYYTKDGDYKSVTNGTFSQWQLYINADNKLYNKRSVSETVFWDDGSVNEDEVLKTEINKNVTEILGYACDELIMTCKSGIQKYYFSSKLPVNIDLYTKHKYGNWYDYLLLTHALPLKMIMETPQLTVISVAVEVKPMKLDAALFQLPAGAKIEKSKQR